MTDQEWAQLDAKDATLEELERQYKKPRYNPFEIFNPTKGFIKEVIKQLKQQPYASTKYIYEIEKEWGFLPESIKNKRDKLLRRIREYELYLSGDIRKSDIGEYEIKKAKEVPIESLYDGRLRRRGRTSTGLCPFHEEAHASFAIYMDNNRFTCFGACGISGDSIDFIMKRDSIDFISAVKYLNQK